MTRRLNARADRAVLVTRAPLRQRVDPLSHTNLPRGRRHRAVLLMVPATARLGAAAVLHRSGARSRGLRPPTLAASFPKPIAPYSPPSPPRRAPHRATFASPRIQASLEMFSWLMVLRIEYKVRVWMNEAKRSREGGYKHHIALTLADADEKARARAVALVVPMVE